MWIVQTREWSDCRLIVAANAALMLGLDPIRPEVDRESWVQLVDAAYASCGSAIRPEIADKKLGVVAIRYEIRNERPWTAADLLPCTGIGIKDPKAGFHCVLVVERSADGLALVGYGWSPQPRWFAFAQVDAMLPSAPTNLRADLFVRRHMKLGQLRELSRLG